ncbi:hypothetical protein BDB00DRAFT_812240 [Zychaea mexicana]|uniref:uncharacterized protein n=1 Tax=Zychaea mexicana TaxID=64656 RepID=UPI0022FF32A4|nr:uncharacterized protein BDB00DRAFT_812240 [Zychaea mexicana]KAI9495874.1 hypothetical protein BDB00DRAFT_812240 [Zychaea mexicana]
MVHCRRPTMMPPKITWKYSIATQSERCMKRRRRGTLCRSLSQRTIQTTSSCHRIRPRSPILCF